MLPRDGKTVGEIEVRGPWITGVVLPDDPAPEKFHDGWLRTGDVGTLDARGFIRLTDRAKDVIKSGGEWISSMELENVLMAHPDVAEAAVVGVPDERWAERPLGCVVRRPGSTVTPAELRAFLAGKWPGGGFPSAGASSRRCRKHQRRQVRQKSAARALRRGRADHRHRVKGKLELRGESYFLDGRAIPIGAALELSLSGGRWLRCQYRWNGEATTLPVFSLVLGGYWERRVLGNPKLLHSAPEAIVRVELDDADFRWPVDN